MSDTLLRERVRQIEARLQRPLRVLHIGNIANNAYINSKLLTELGVESHVMCYDYYHVMGTPEWEDAFFDSNQINHFFPEWRALDLGNFERPRWFVQGPLKLCLQYLLALQTGHQTDAIYLQRQLTNFNRTRAPWSIRFATSASRRKLRELPVLFAELCTRRSVKDAFYSHFPDQKIRYSLQSIFQIAFELPVYLFALIMKRSKLARLFQFDTTVVSGAVSDSPQFRAQLIREFKDEFPNRPDQLRLADFEILTRYSETFSRVLSYYDVIHGYATDPALPMLCGLKNYVAYEHGTIRTYVYNDSAISRFAALAYRKATAILSTNADCLPSAKFLKGKNSIVVRGLHGFDERQVLKRFEFANLNRTRREARFNISDDVCVFLQPARQDWSIKGNDRVLEAIRILKSRRSKLKRPFVVVLTEWGNDIGRAKEFIQKHRLEDDVQWIDILSKVNLIHSVSFVDGIIDQFLIPCIGAVPAEILTVANGPIITYLDDKIMSEFYGRTLPVLNAQSADEIAIQMEKVINELPEAKQSLIDSKKWVREIHSHTQVVSKCLDAYDQVLKTSSSEGQK